MLRLLHKPEKGVVFQEYSPDRLEERLAADGGVWIDVLDPTAKVVARIGDRFGFDRVALEDVLEYSEFPKVDDFGEHVFMVVHGLGAERADRLRTVELDLFVGSDYLVTFHQGEIPALAATMDHALHSPAYAEGGPDRMAARLAEAQVRHFLPLVEALDDRIDEIDDRALVGDPTVITDVQALRRDVIRLRRVVGPQREVMLTLSREYSGLMGQRARLRFGDVYDHLYRLVETLDSARGLLGAVLETYRSAVAEKMNEVMKVLTVFSAVLLPLTVIVGIWGMNVVNLPLAQRRSGFVWLMVVMAVIGLGLWTYFARRGFVGGPRVRDLPKVVGEGLLHLAIVPVRSMTGLFTPRPRSEGNHTDD